MGIKGVFLVGMPFLYYKKDDGEEKRKEKKKGMVSI